MNNYKILMFAPYFSPYGVTENNPEAVVNRKLALAMLDTGWAVDVITRKIIPGSNEPLPTIWKAPWERLQNCTFELPYFEGMGRRPAGILKLAANALRYGHYVDGMGVMERELKLAFDRHSKNPYDAVISRSVPDQAHLPALVFNRKTSVPWIANFNDPTGGKLPLPYDIKTPAIYKFLLNRYFESVADSADFLTFPSGRLLRYVTGYLGRGTAKKSSVIPHIAYDFPVNRPRSKNEAFTIGYAGSLDTKYRSPDAFFTALSSFVKKKGLLGKIKLRCFGIFDENLFKVPKAEGIYEGTVVLEGNLSYIGAVSELARCDVNLVIEAPFKEGYFMPSKLTDYVQAGRPVLAVSPRTGVMNDVMSAHRAGIFADNASCAAITAALEKLYSAWERDMLNESFDPVDLKKFFSKEAVIGDYTKLFKRLGVANG